MRAVQVTMATARQSAGSLRTRWRDVVARAVHGLSWRMLWLGASVVAVHTLFSWALATGPGRGLNVAELVAVYARLFTGDLLQYSTALVGIVVWNLLPGPTLRRVVAAALAVTIASWLVSLRVGPFYRAAYGGWFEPGGMHLRTWLSYYWIRTMLCAIILIAMAREADAARAVERERSQALAFERGLSEARLQVSQAQIEPHFLFNTLATVRRLYAVDPVAGRAMSRHFATMLARALPAMRDTRSTLGRELAHATAYLEVQRIRMGARLTCRIDVPADLHDAAFPPLMLATLVENAIKHGLASLEEGGSVTIEASAADGMLDVRVLDTGRGLLVSCGTGVGLTNIESRLAAMFAGRGRLELRPNEPRGVVASITVPIDFACEARA